jgi:hypothetical protein
MLNHIVVMKFKPDLSESDIHSVIMQLADLQKIIPSIKHFSFGKNCSPEQLHKGFTHVFVMSFDDAKGRDVYLEHPEHQRIAAEILVPMLEDALNSVVVIDYEYQ